MNVKTFVLEFGDGCEPFSFFLTASANSDLEAFGVTVCYAFVQTFNNLPECRLNIGEV